MGAVLEEESFPLAAASKGPGGEAYMNLNSSASDRLLPLDSSEAFIPKMPDMTDSGRKMMVTTVKTTIARPWPTVSTDSTCALHAWNRLSCCSLSAKISFIYIEQTDFGQLEYIAQQKSGRRQVAEKG